MTSTSKSTATDVDWWNASTLEHLTGKRRICPHKSFIQLFDLLPLDAGTKHCETLEPLQVKNDSSKIFSI